MLISEQLIYVQKAYPLQAQRGIYIEAYSSLGLIDIFKFNVKSSTSSVISHLHKIQTKHKYVVQIRCPRYNGQFGTRRSYGTSGHVN